MNAVLSASVAESVATVAPTEALSFTEEAESAMFVGASPVPVSSPVSRSTSLPLKRANSMSSTTVVAPLALFVIAIVPLLFSVIV